MATAAPTITKIGEHTVKFVWALTSANADGAPIGKRFVDYADRSVQIEGTFGAGTVVFQGSNDGGSNYQPLTDPQGNAISTTATKLEQITEATQLQRPVVTGADGATAVTITVIARRQRGGKEV